MAALLQHELLGPRKGGRAAAGEQLRGQGDEDLGQRAAGGHEDRVRQGHWLPRGCPGHSGGPWAAMRWLGWSLGFSRGSEGKLKKSKCQGNN